MNLLAIETSTDLASVALSVGPSVFSLEQAGVRQHAQHLLPMIQTLMVEHQINWSALHGIVFGVGPGSFTGLRIACSIAKALAYAHDLPLFGVGTMPALAYQAQTSMQAQNLEAGILAMGDARMQEVYWSYYPISVPLVDAQVHVSSVQSILVGDTAPLVVAGWGLEAYQQQLPSALQDRLLAYYPMHPRADALIHMVQTGMISANTAEDALPLYIRNNVTGEIHG